MEKKETDEVGTGPNFEGFDLIVTQLVHVFENSLIYKVSLKILKTNNREYNLIYN